MRDFYLDQPIEWQISDVPVPYTDALEAMEHRARLIGDGKAGECAWLLEHPPVYTGGTSARPQDLRNELGLPVFQVGRGGQFTYHGPGQRVVYLMLDLKRRRQDVRAFVHALEDWLIDTLAAFNVRGERRRGRVGIWVTRPELGADKEEKIAAIGIRLKKWVSFHGISLNVDPDLSHYGGIVPCGIADHGVTSLVALGHLASMSDADSALRQAFESHFGRTEDAAPLYQPAAIPSLRKSDPARNTPPA